ncbi:hypothetical protein [Zavarzinella formosa]|uniref:hypothetical protein n=1 Tax=Zavarzinella formosa TaxID=360055 RepID=UPI0002F2BAA4|nr:hypothetical protein [Zavarzinella formosa]
MKPLKPNGQIDLEHRVEFLRGSLGNSVILASADNGHVSLIDLDLNSVRHSRPTTELRGIALHPFEPLIAFADDTTGSLIVQRFDGTSVAQIESPDLAEDAPEWMLEGFIDCHFDPDGDFLWLLASLGDDACEVLLVETKGWSVVQRETITDDFGSCFWSFHSTGRPGLISLWMAAAQDGQVIYWLTRKGSNFTVAQEKTFGDCTSPVFSSDGSEFLVLITSDLSIGRLSFPSMEELNPPLSSPDEVNSFDSFMCYLDHENALIRAGEGRIFLIDTTTMTIKDELAIQGHEPGPFGKYFPTLSEVRGLATDITMFERLGNLVVFVFRRDRGTEVAGWKDSLLWCSVSELTN